MHYTSVDTVYGVERRSRAERIVSDGDRPSGTVGCGGELQRDSLRLEFPFFHVDPLFTFPASAVLAPAWN